MKHPFRTGGTRRGFTILELLVVISIIAIIATLATGAAVKSMKQSRNRRIQTMAVGLEVALSNYRAQENEWPFDLNACVRKDPDETRYWIHGEKNALAFKKLFSGQTSYLDTSAYLVTVQGRRMSLKDAILKNGKSVEAAIGYQHPENTSRFCYYCVVFNPLTDTVKVVREDQKHHNAEGIAFDCPGWKKTP